MTTISINTAAASPQRIDIIGYQNDAMEPFITSDGQILFFNNSNEKPEKTDLFWAKRVGETHFQFMGRIKNANSLELDAVPSLSDNKEFCFVSLRDYLKTLSSLFCGGYNEGGVTKIVSLSELSRQKLGIIIFDASITRDGQDLIFVEGQFSGGPIPDTAQLSWAEKKKNKWVLNQQKTDYLKNINKLGHVYAPELSADKLHIFFTRVTGSLPFLSVQLYYAQRPQTTVPFGKARQISTLTGINEAGTFDGYHHVVYHHKDKDGYRLYRQPFPH